MVHKKTIVAEYGFESDKLAFKDILTVYSFYFFSSNHINGKMLTFIHFFTGCITRDFISVLPFMHNVDFKVNFLCDFF